MISVDDHKLVVHRTTVVPLYNDVTDGPCVVVVVVVVVSVFGMFRRSFPRGKIGCLHTTKLKEKRRLEEAHGEPSGLWV